VTGDLAAELLAMEHGFWGAVTDPAFYEENTSDDAVFVFPYGVGIMDKRMTVYAIRMNGEEWIAHEFTDVQVVPLGDEAAVITYQAVAERSDDDPFKAFVSSTYVRRDDRWLLAFHQQTLASIGR
jgi:hypothetical protein